MDRKIQSGHDLANQTQYLYNLGMPDLAFFVIRQCSRPTCAFRFPIERDNRKARICPKCGAETRVAVEIAPQPTLPDVEWEPENLVLEALLDNIRSSFNVGAIFRTADGAGFHHIHLCGITPTPADPRIRKTALGAEAHLGWSYSPNSLDAADRLKNEGKVLWALEYSSEAVPIFEVMGTSSQVPVVLVVGNERAGVDPDLLRMCDRHLWIPMRGQKESLNVAVAFSIAAYSLRFVTVKN